MEIEQGFPCRVWWERLRFRLWLALGFGFGLQGSEFRVVEGLNPNPQPETLNSKPYPKPQTRMV